MDYLADYLAVVSREHVDDSVLVALLPAGALEPDPVALADALTGVPELRNVKVGEPTGDESGWTVQVEAEGLPGRGAQPSLPKPLTLKFTVGARPNRSEDLHLEWHRLTKSQTEAAAASEWALGVSMAFGESPLLEFHRQVQLLAALAPDAVAVLDTNACLVHPGDWMRDVAGSRVPPPPQSLFTIHMIYDDAAPGGCWLHTHGLLRCACLELEALDIPRDDSGLVGHLMNAAAARFIEERPPAPDTPFLAGKDMELVWLPWQQGVTKMKPSMLGASPERDQAHARPSAMLFVPRRKLFGGRAYDSLARLLPKLSDNPVLYISNMETRRMAMLARERLSHFLALHAKHASAEAWAFLVKLGYPMDHDPETREHLWFQVHAVDGRDADATLINQPYSVSGMKEGDRGRHSLELLSDWMIICRRGRFGPENVFELLQASAPDPLAN